MRCLWIDICQIYNFYSHNLIRLDYGKFRNKQIHQKILILNSELYFNRYREARKK